MAVSTARAMHRHRSRAGVAGILTAAAVILAGPALGQADGGSERLRLQQQIERQQARIEALESKLLEAEGESADERPLRDRLRRAVPERRDGGAQPVDREALAAVIERLDPEYRDRVGSIVWNDTPDRGGGTLDAEAVVIERARRRLLPRLSELGRLLDDDPELFEAKLTEFQAGMRILDAARAVRDRSVESESPPDAAWDEVSSLREAIAAGHDARLAVHRIDLDRMVQRTKALEREVATASETKPERVAEQVERILTRIGRGESGPPDWRRRSRDD